MIWSFIQTIGKQGTTFIVLAILAMFLDPTDFGIIGMALTWVAFIQVFSEIGFGAALIQRQNVKSKHFSTVFFVNVVSGILLTFIGIICSWPCALFFKTPEIQPVMAVLSSGFIINSFSLTQLVIAQKELRFKDLAIRDISASLFGGGIGIALAYLKYGVWSLVAQLIITYLVASILLWNMTKWRPILREFSFQCIRDLWQYSSKILAFNIFKYFTQNIDKLFVGYLLGPVALGLYTFAFKVAVQPISIVTGAIGGYLFPKYSMMQEDLSAIKKSYLFVNKVINSIATPLMVIIVLLSPILIPLIWGQKWIQTIPLIQVLAILGVLESLVSPVGQLMKALDRPGWLFNWSIVITVMVSIFIWVGTYYRGIIGATFGITTAYIIGLVVILFIIRKLVHISIHNILTSLIPSILSSLLMGLLLFWILNSKMLLTDTKIFIGLFLSGLLYAICLILFDNPFVITIYRRLVKV